MPLEDARTPIHVSAARPHLILDTDRRGFFLALTILVISIMVPHDIRVNIAGITLAVLIFIASRHIGTHAPYALDELQRFAVLPRWGTASASVHASTRDFTPYPRKERP